MTVTGIAARLYERQEFPYEAPGELVDDHSVAAHPDCR